MPQPDAPEFIKGGYYIKARIIQESKIAHMPPYVREIWDWLLRNANHKDKKYNGFIVKRGQLFRNYKDIREGLHWMVGYRKMMYNENQTKKGMKALRDALMITTAKALGGVLITILNYDRYQNPKNYERTNESTNESTPTEPMENHPIPDNNNNDNNEEETNSNVPYKKIILYLNKKANHRFEADPVAKDYKKYIKARWNDNSTLQDFYDVINFKVSKWLTDDKMNQYLRPETLFGTKFKTYLAEAKKWTETQTKTETRKMSKGDRLYEGYDYLKKHGKGKFLAWCIKEKIPDEDRRGIMGKYERENK